MNSFISVVIVTHNSQMYLDKCMSSLLAQTYPPEQVIVIDSGSKDISYLQPYKSHATIKCVENVGFAEGNNLGWNLVSSKTDYVLFINPDAFLTLDFFKNAVDLMEKEPHCGILTGQLHAYDFEKEALKGTLDSTGIFSTWYGKWYDRGQGETVEPLQYQNQESIPAICGALMFCRKEALKNVLNRGELWDASYFMYKEDIDLSLRLRKKGWELIYTPNLIAYHGRGWQERKSMPRTLRLRSARNELQMNWKNKLWRYLPYSLTKLACVSLFDI